MGSQVLSNKQNESKAGYFDFTNVLNLLMKRCLLKRVAFSAHTLLEISARLNLSTAEIKLSGTFSLKNSPV